MSLGLTHTPPDTILGSLIATRTCGGFLAHLVAMPSESLLAGLEHDTNADGDLLVDRHVAETPRGLGRRPGLTEHLGPSLAWLHVGGVAALVHAGDGRRRG